MQRRGEPLAPAERRGWPEWQEWEEPAVPDAGRFRTLIGRSAAAFDLELSTAAIDAFCDWLELVVQWNERTDLTAARDDAELVDLFVSDPIAVRQHCEPIAREAWVDVGSGAGAPGIALRILGVPLTTLVEPKDKRVSFLRTVIGRLELSELRVERARCEQLASQSFDVAISRATLPPPQWVEEGSRLARREVWVLLGRDEPPDPPGWQLHVDHRYELPLTGAPRRVVSFRKRA